MIYHIVAGDAAASQLQQAIAIEPTLEGKVAPMNDILNIGQLQQKEGQSFSEMRMEFRRSLINHYDKPIHIDDLERLLEACNELSKSKIAIMWLWVAPAPADVCMYLWALSYAAKYAGRVYVVNIEGLPFLDEDGKIFFPRKLDNIPPKELVKARKLARPVTPAEIETDLDDWRRLTEENTMIRIHGGGKKIASKPADFYDEILIGLCTPQTQKTNRIISHALNKNNIPVDDAFLAWRLQQIAETGALQLQWDMTRPFRDGEVRVSEK